MISKVSSVLNFGSSFIKNNSYYAGIYTAKECASSTNLFDQMQYHQFNNAMEYLLNDEKMDVFRIENQNESFILLKNDEVVRVSNFNQSAGNSIINLISNYVQKDLKVPIHKETVKNASSKNDIVMIKKDFNKAILLLESAKERLSSLEDQMDSSLAETAKNKLDSMA